MVLLCCWFDFCSYNLFRKRKFCQKATRPYSSVVEHFIRNEKVRGSIPRAGYTMKFFSPPPINCGSGKVLALLAFAPFVATVVSTSSTPPNSLLLDGPSNNIMHSSRFYNFGQSLADVDILTLFLANI